MFRLWRILCLLMLILSACTLPPELITPQASVAEDASADAAGDSHDSTNSVNVVESATLRNTVEIRVLQITVGEQASFELVAKITDVAAITAIVDSLNQTLPLQPGLRCPDAYAIEFVGSDEAMNELRYFCAESPVYLRGEAVSPEGDAIEAPAEFNQLIGDAIQSVGG